MCRFTLPEQAARPTSDKANAAESARRCIAEGAGVLVVVIGSPGRWRVYHAVLTSFRCACVQRTVRREAVQRRSTPTKAEDGEVQRSGVQ